MAKNVVWASFKALLFELMRHRIYSKIIHRALFRPKYAMFNITDNCNSKCIVCNAWKKKSKDELTTDEVIQILSQLRSLGISRVGFGGGEPTLRKDLPDIIQKSSKLGFKRVSMITNSLSLNEKRAEILLKSGLTAIGISIDGTGETNDMIRGINGAYEKSLSTLKTLVEMRDDKYPYLDIWISTTLMRQNIDQIEEIIGKCKQLNVRIFLNLLDTSPYFFSGVDVSDLIIENQNDLDILADRLHEIKRELPSVLTQSHVSIEYARKYFSDPKREDIPCYVGYHFVYIGAHGEVYPGCWVLKPVGSLREKELKEIMNSKKWEARLKNMFAKKCPGCTCGYSTNLLYHVESIIGEALWRSRIKR